MKDIRYALKSCVWEITLACCFQCKHCGSKAGIAKENELTAEECINVARQLAELGCRRVSLIGGEVFMRNDWSTIVQALTKRGVSVSIITNGYIFDEVTIELLIESKIESVAVSIDGNETVHDYLRQKGSYKRAITAVDILNKANIPVSIITTLNKMNINCLEELFNVLSEKGIVAWQLQACSPMGNAAGLKLQYQFDHIKAIEFVKKHLNEIEFALGVADNIGYYSKEEGYVRGDKNGNGFFKGCTAGLTSIGIDSVGNVRGCESMYDEVFIEGNLREKPLKEIWEDTEAFSYNRKFNPRMLTGLCSTCKYGSICAGGCRSYNYFSSMQLYNYPNCLCDTN